jgi:stalled ribosome alternative rescue factor ArfA
MSAMAHLRPTVRDFERAGSGARRAGQAFRARVDRAREGKGRPTRPLARRCILARR